MTEPLNTNEAADGRSDSNAGLERQTLPDVLFDGFAVYQELDNRAQARTSPVNVSDVLDAVVRLMRSNVELTGDRLRASREQGERG